jgi:hypothetical protein
VDYVEGIQEVRIQSEGIRQGSTCHAGRSLRPPKETIGAAVNNSFGIARSVQESESFSVGNLHPRSLCVKQLEHTIVNNQDVILDITRTVLLE